MIFTISEFLLFQLSTYWLIQVFNDSDSYLVTDVWNYYEQRFIENILVIGRVIEFQARLNYIYIYTYIWSSIIR